MSKASVAVHRMFLFCFRAFSSFPELEILVSNPDELVDSSDLLSLARVTDINKKKEDGLRFIQVVSPILSL